MPIAGGILVAGSSASRYLSSAAGMLRFLARLSGRRRHVRRSCGPPGGGGGGCGGVATSGAAAAAVGCCATSIQQPQQQQAISSVDERISGCALTEDRPDAITTMTRTTTTRLRETRTTRMMTRMTTTAARTRRRSNSASRSCKSPPSSLDAEYPHEDLPPRILDPCWLRHDLEAQEPSIDCPKCQERLFLVGEIPANPLRTDSKLSLASSSGVSSCSSSSLLEDDHPQRTSKTTTREASNIFDPAQEDPSNFEPNSQRLPWSDLCDEGYDDQAQGDPEHPKNVFHPRKRLSLRDLETSSIDSSLASSSSSSSSCSPSRRRLRRTASCPPSSLPLLDCATTTTITRTTTTTTITTTTSSRPAPEPEYLLFPEHHQCYHQYHHFHHRHHQPQQYQPFHHHHHHHHHHHRHHHYQHYHHHHHHHQYHRHPCLRHLQHHHRLYHETDKIINDDRRNTTERKIPQHVQPQETTNFSNSSNTRRRTIPPYLATLLIISYTLFGIADACSSRSTPKPRPPTPTPRPNITFHMYTCPPDYAEWYCLNGATCFTVKIQESLLYNCLCANGFVGQRCEFKDLDGSYLPSRQRVMLETASIAGGATIAVFLVVIICIAAYIHCKRKQKELRTSSTCVDTVDGPGRDPELRPFSNRSRSLMIFMAKNPNGSTMCPIIEQTRMPGWSDYSGSTRMASVSEGKRGSSQQ